jgi:hypothetical protein
MRFIDWLLKLVIFLMIIVLLHIIINLIIKAPVIKKIEKVERKETKKDLEIEEEKMEEKCSSSIPIAYEENYDIFKMSEENLLKWFDGEVEKVSDKKNDIIIASNSNNSEMKKEKSINSFTDVKTFTNKLQETNKEIDSFNENDYTYASFKY